MTVRLVKGAYWDTEIKRAQERGLADYPVFTRKPMTDLNYMACVRRLVDARPRLYPQFATHNALTVASIIEDAGGPSKALNSSDCTAWAKRFTSRCWPRCPQAACRVYAPVGSHRDLLAYLVRRLLENGANSSFVAVAADPNVPVEEILRRPAGFIGDAAHARHPHIPLPRDLYKPARLNSAGVEFGDRAALKALVMEVGRAAPKRLAGGAARRSGCGDRLRRRTASPHGAPTALERRAEILDRAAELLEASRGKLIALIQAEGGKTLDDALSELREAVDYCRYYAAEARRTLKPTPMPGPTGESNELRYRGRGVFVCISPWNFPLAIFLGQVTAALAAGNAVVAKPAEQTPLIGAAAVRLLHQAGVPESALVLVQGDGKVGAALVADPRVAGVAFTGSTEVGHAINRALAAKDGPIVPLIAETGGINAMIVDATALPEQVTDDVVTSAFRSAGQRCSALRLLCVQEDVADRIDRDDRGRGEGAFARRSARSGDTRGSGDRRRGEAEARPLDRRPRAGRVIFRWDNGRALPAGRFVPPTMIALDRASDLQEEVFGPVLHVVRWRAAALDALLDDIAGNGTGLTLGIHTRIDAVAEKIAARLSNGNVYVNRSIIGAVVGTQPFGGAGLSGTGPKAGGPNYLRRFASEQTVTVNTAAAGGNATLLSERE